MKSLKDKHFLSRCLSILPLLIIAVMLMMGAISPNYSGSIPNSRLIAAPEGTYGCGSEGSGNESYAVQTSINFGCYGDQCVTGKDPTSKYCSSQQNPIIDILFAIIRFLTDGVGIIVVLSIIIGGVQYIVSRGDPQGTQAALKRISSAAIALVVFIFGYAILNYVIPGAFFK